MESMLNLFETPFKHIQAGHRFSPLVYPVSEELIFKYGEAVDDLNSPTGFGENLSGLLGNHCPPPCKPVCTESLSYGLDSSAWRNPAEASSDFMNTSR
jgi:hypothetical protein